VPIAWESPLALSLKARYGSGIEPLTFVGQPYFNVDKSVISEVLEILHDDQQFDYCVDVTAVHYPKRTGKEFEIIWILYSHPRNERIRVKISIADGEPAPSVTKLWRTANWLEREAYDMFGITFEGHPDLRRILMPDGWKGHPLRKDYNILKQDTDWVKANLGIESAQ
jgi:NADH-quinone oxidoreductase subunit C